GPLVYDLLLSCVPSPRPGIHRGEGNAQIRARGLRRSVGPPGASGPLAGVDPLQRSSPRSHTQPFPLRPRPPRGLTLPPPSHTARHALDARPDDPGESPAPPASTPVVSPSIAPLPTSQPSFQGPL